MRTRGSDKLIRRMLLILDIVVIAAFVAGYSAAYVSPERAWWLQPFGAVLPFAALTVIAATLACGAAGWWRLFAAHVVLCLLAGGRLLSLPASVPTVAEGVDSLRVMTLNARFSWAVRDARPDRTVDDLVAAEQPDVIALQEADIVFQDDSRDIAMLLPVEIKLTERGYRTVPPEDTRKRQFNPVVSRLPLLSHTEHFIARADPKRQSPTITRTVFEWGGEEIALYGVHLKSFSGTPDEERSMPSRMDPRGWPERLGILRDTYRAHVAQIDSLTAMLHSETRPYIVCGDLNSTPNSWVYRRVASVGRDAFRSRRAGRGATYPALFPLVRIDFVFVGPGWTILDARTAEPARSDHRAVLADLAR